ncbi:recombinase family protein [uncultured Hymenobacter sp.]|uniref:recombinase family protein n=1 Tax=uncultured Hymenobacter sp. TaxID=170016 RepID=UPI0035C9CC84
MVYGYARQTTPDHPLAQQVEALRAYGCACLVEEEAAAGKERPALRQLLTQLHAGDTLVVWKLDRLARSLKDVLALLHGLAQHGVHFVSLQDQLDTTTPAGQGLFTLVAVLAELERERPRTRAGGPGASAPGRPKGLTVEALSKAQAAKTLYVKKNKTVAQISRLLGVGRATIYRYLHYLGIPPFRDNEKNR